MLRWIAATSAVLVFVGAAAPNARGDVQPAAWFADHMVLQCGMPVPVWGTASPSEAVTVAFGAATAEAKADARGAWRAMLPPLEVSREPRRLVVRGANEVTINDVLVGEVWLCAGQSNMLLPVARAQDADRALATADRPLLRLHALRAAATGDRVAYTSEQIEKLVPEEFFASGWLVCSPRAAREFSAVGYYFGRRLQERLGTPVGIICAAVGGSPTEAWIRPEALASEPTLAPLVVGDWTKNPSLTGWCTERAAYNLARARRDGEPIPGDALGPNHPFKPGFLWNASIAPLAPLAIRGIAWYQGESNAESLARVAQHAHLFPTLVRDWRRQWARDDLPFVCVQLPGMDRPHWPEFRETQRRAVATIPHTGMVVTIDLGTKHDVHPGDKAPVGERLAGWALSEVYGREGASGFAPAPASAEFRDDGTVLVRFHEQGGNLRTSDGERPRHFEAAGADGVFRAATARIDHGMVIVEPAEASSPARQIRYAWMPFPEPSVNLVNGDGLPATPFLLQKDDGTPD